jgi:hypothetical protein
MFRRDARIDPAIGISTAPFDDQPKFVECQPVAIDVAGLVAAYHLLSSAVKAPDQEPLVLVDEVVKDWPALCHRAMFRIRSP